MTHPVSSSHFPPSLGLFNRPLWSLGFRPFYLLGATASSLLVILWLLHLQGVFNINGPFAGAVWHAHEMIFGYAAAVLTGFLFTAVKNWTGLMTPQGGRLALLSGLWLAARVLMITGPSALASIVDLAFLPLVAVSIAMPMWQSGNRRNLVLVVMIGLLFIANCLYHADAWGLVKTGGEAAFVVGLDIFALLITLIAGRVMPMFINNAIAGAGAGRIKQIELGCLVGMALILVIDVARAFFPAFEEAPGARFAYALLLFGLAGLHLTRLYRWRVHKTLHNAIVWIMPLSYFWLTASLVVKAIALIWPAVDPLIWVHLLVVGAIGGMMIGMMTRSALGHTGRPVRAGLVEILCFWLIQLALAARLASFAVPTDYYFAALSATTVFWSTGFGLFAVAYWPKLSRPRANAP